VPPLAQAFVRLRVDSAQVKKDTEAGMESAATGPQLKRSGSKAATTFGEGFGSQMKKGVPEFAKAGEDAGKTWGARFGGAAGKATRTLALVGTAALAGAAVESVRLATSFQSAMKKVQTQAGASAGDVRVLSKEILSLGGKVQQTPLELANAMYHLKSVGLDNVQAMKALKAASDLAAVGGANLEETTNAIAGAWRSGIKGAGSFGQAAATTNAIIGAGNMRMQDFIDAIGTGFLPSARSFGVSLSSIGSALALMTDEGIPANVAATRLRMTLSLLGAPSGKAADQLELIGIKGNQLANAMRSPRGIVSAVGLLKSHLDASGLSATQQAILLSRAFGGGRSSSAILTLINNYDVLHRKQDQINSSMGKFGPAVIAQRKTAQAQWGLLRSSLDTLGVRVGTVLLPVITKTVGWFSNLRNLMPVLIGVMGLLTAAILIQAAAWALTPIGQVAILIGLITAGIILLATHWTTIWHGMLVAVNVVWSWIKQNWPLLTVIILGPIGLAVVGIIKNWGRIKAGALDVYHFLLPVFRVIGAIGRAAFLVISTAAKIAFDIIYGLILLDAFLIRHILSALGVAGAWVFVHVIQPAARAVWSAVVAYVRVMWSIVHPILNVFGSVAQAIWGGIKRAASILWAGVTSDVRLAMGIGKTLLRSFWNVVSSVFGFIINGAAKAFGWVPGLGPKLKDAARQFNTFRDRVNADLNGVKSRTINVSLAFGSNKVNNPPLTHKAAGGYVRGPGGPTADQIPAMLSNREYVVNAAAVNRYGVGMLDAINTQHFAGGGLAVRAVTPSAASIRSTINGQVDKLAQQYLSSLAGSGVGGMGDSGARTHSAAVAQAYARSILGRWGWAQSQMNYLIPLWNQESGWSAYAVNQSSGAYGIPQSLGHGHPYNLGDYVNQIIWGLNYIRGRYGSPAAAWAHEQANNWYGKGGLVSAFSGGAVTRMANGGVIGEPVMGIGASGRRYQLGEAGSEVVTPGDVVGRQIDLLARIDAKLAALIGATKETPAGFAQALNHGAGLAAHGAR
jgi:TP901 family phage tail tape measure protein